LTGVQKVSKLRAFRYREKPHPTTREGGQGQAHRQSVTIDWTLRESARAKVKVMVKRILRKHGYPPDLQEEATKTVLLQAETLCAEWAA
jgi:hypothetical protein